MPGWENFKIFSCRVGISREIFVTSPIESTARGGAKAVVSRIVEITVFEIEEVTAWLLRLETN